MQARNLLALVLGFAVHLNSSETLFGQQEKQDKVISAEEFRLLDAKGKVAGNVTVLDDGTVQIGILRDHQWLTKGEPLPFEVSLPLSFSSERLGTTAFDSARLGFRSGFNELGDFEKGSFFEAVLSIPVHENWFAETTLGAMRSGFDAATFDVGDLHGQYYTLGIGHSFPVPLSSSDNEMGTPSLEFRPKLFGKFQQNDFDIDSSVSAAVQDVLGLEGYDAKFKNSLGLGIGGELAYRIGTRLEVGISIDYTWMNAKVEESTFNSPGSLVTGISTAAREDLDGYAIGFTLGVRF